MVRPPTGSVSVADPSAATPWPTRTCRPCSSLTSARTAASSVPATCARGVPCWIDTGHPDPEAVAPFYSELFGWELEDVMPPEAEGKYLIGRIRGGDVAALGGQPEGGPRGATWNTYVWVESADQSAAKV